MRQVATYLGFLFLSAGLYILLLYGIPRSNFGVLLGLFGGLFGLYAGLLHQQGLLGKASSFTLSKPCPIAWLMGGAILLRLVALFALPNLSDDYFRFIWDGLLVSQGENPFLTLPSAYMALPDQGASLGLRMDLFEGMNSPEYYTIYPPVLQAVFALGASLFPHNTYGAVLVMKGVVFLAECGSLWLMLRLLPRLGLPRHSFIWYAFNPLVIVELCGNLHFEALMIFFLLWALDLLMRGKIWVSVLPFALAVASKLWPLMLLPFLWRRLGFWRTGLYGGLVLLLFGLSFVPLLNVDSLAGLFDTFQETLLTAKNSFDLYFAKFEFNASVWYIIRAAGFAAVDYNIIGMAAPYLSLSVVVLIFLFVWLERKPRWTQLPSAMLAGLMIYFMLATIVHPWYCTPLVALCVLGPYRFPVLWSFLLPLSYFPYQTEAYTESLGLITLSYLVLGLFLIWELKQKLGGKVMNSKGFQA